MKKICSIALAVFMILTCMVSVGAADVSKGNSAADFLGMLGIADIEANAEPITRAAFTEMLVKAMNYVPDTYKNGLFTDVTASSRLKSEAAIRVFSECLIMRKAANT